MSNSLGKIFTLTTFGESHGEAIGGVIDGCPAGIELNFEAIQNEHEHGRIGKDVGQILDRLPLTWYAPQITTCNIGRSTHRGHHHPKQRYQPYQQGNWQCYFISSGYRGQSILFV